MKTLFTSDHAAWLFLASFPVLAGGLLLGWPALTAAGILALYVSFDVLGYKWVLNHSRDILVLGGSNEVEMTPDSEGKFRLDFTYFRVLLHRDHRDRPLLAYRLFQHGLMLPVLALAWICAGPAAVIVPVVVWLTYGADALYHPVARAPFAPWNSRTYYNHGYWTVVGWWYVGRAVWRNIRAGVLTTRDLREAGGIPDGSYTFWNRIKLLFAEKEIIPASAMYTQAIAGAIAAVGVLIWA